MRGTTAFTLASWHGGYSEATHPLERDAAVGAAWMASGVSEVRDDLVVTG